MAEAMPVSLEFHLPEGWKPARPDAVGAPGAAFVALHAASEGPGFTTNITMDEQQRDDATLAEVADESLTSLHRSSQRVSLSHRSEFGSEDAPGLTQILRVAAQVEGETLELVQCQVYLLMRDVHDRHRQAVVRLVLTATSGVFDTVLPDFQEFVGSVRPKDASDDEAG
ncbi:hypothetical protein [Bounagaea algeriensis]